MDTRTRDDIIAEGCPNFDSVDLVTSPHGGHLVVVSVSEGVHVCQGCGEPFTTEGDHAPVEKKTAGATVPILMHAGCALGPRKRFFSAALGSPRGLMKAVAGANALKMAKRVLAGSHKLAEIARESAKKIVL